MKYTLEPCIDASIAYKISVEVESYSGAKEAFVSGLPEDCTPYEDEEIEYNIVQIITYTDDVKDGIVSIGNSLDLPTRVDRDKFEKELIDLHVEKLKCDADDYADYQYEESRVRR